jgi:hypothetical protein
VLAHATSGASDAPLSASELDATGDVVLIPLERTKIEPRRNLDGTWRWYGVYAVPDDTGGGTIRVRLDTTDEDRRRKFNRAEHLRTIPPSDPDDQRLYPAAQMPSRSTAHSTTAAGSGRAHSADRVASSSTSSATSSP